MFALRRAVAPRSVSVAVRSLHSSSSVAAKKAKPAQTQEDDFEMDDDLFSGAEASETSSSGRGALRAQYANAILAKNITRVGELRKVISLSEAADMEGLDEILRAWRLAGQRVTTQTATELVGRCLKLGRADLAKKFTSDRLTYGVPTLPANIEAKLQKGLAQA